VKKPILLILIYLALFIQCQKKKHLAATGTKIEIIAAENIYDLGGSMRMRFFSDSSYTFTVLEESPNYEKTEKFTGFYFIDNDTIRFSPFEFKYANIDKAIIKNNFIEFINSPLRIEIQKNDLNSKSELNFRNYQNYAVFTFNPRIYSSAYYNYDPTSVNLYNLKQNDLEELDSILKNCFSKNSAKLRTFDNYVFQCIPVVNSNQEIEVWVWGYCKGIHQNKEYKYSIIRMNDGGNCNISLKVNLTKNNYSELNIAGEA
jgi:hypothetical protein